MSIWIRLLSSLFCRWVVQVTNVQPERLMQPLRDSGSKTASFRTHTNTCEKFGKVVRSVVIVKSNESRSVHSVGSHGHKCAQNCRHSIIENKLADCTLCTPYPLLATAASLLLSRHVASNAVQPCSFIYSTRQRASHARTRVLATLDLFVTPSMWLHCPLPCPFLTWL